MYKPYHTECISTQMIAFQYLTSAVQDVARNLKKKMDVLQVPASNRAHSSRRKPRDTSIGGNSDDSKLTESELFAQIHNCPSSRNLNG